MPMTGCAPNFDIERAGGLSASPWEITEDEERDSFEVVDLAALPEIDRDDIPTVPSGDRLCGCHWCEGNWPAIAKAAVTILQEGIDPLDHHAVAARGRELEVAEPDIGWLVSLFSPRDGIIVLRESRQFTNGMHRTHAL